MSSALDTEKQSSITSSQLLALKATVEDITFWRNIITYQLTYLTDDFTQQMSLHNNGKQAPLLSSSIFLLETFLKDYGAAIPIIISEAEQKLIELKHQLSILYKLYKENPVLSIQEDWSNGKRELGAMCQREIEGHSILIKGCAHYLKSGSLHNGVLSSFRRAVNQVIRLYMEIDAIGAKFDSIWEAK